MKNILCIAVGLLFSGIAVAQQPVFLSPYKSGKPVPESAKDYSKPVPVNLLTNGGGNKVAVSTKDNRTTEQKSEPVNETRPVKLNSNKKDFK